jgi:hypothetical protein
MPCPAFIRYETPFFSFGSFWNHYLKVFTTHPLLRLTLGPSNPTSWRETSSSPGLGLTGFFASSSGALFVRSSNFFHNSSNFLCWFYSHNSSNNLDNVLFFNWLWKFALMCLMYHLLLRSGHNATLLRSCCHLLFHWLIAKYLCAYHVWHRFSTSRTTIFFNLSINQY